MTRHAAVDDARRRLLREGWPRLQMLLLVMLTGGAGFLAAWGLLQAGVLRMAVRYPLAVVAAYGVFLVLLWLWLRTRAEDWDLPDFDGGSGRRGDASDWQGGGGHGGGGGASASWDDAGSGGALDAVTAPVGDALGAAAEAEEFALPLAVVLVALAVVAVLLMSSLFLVWSAPVLFAELLVDGVLAAGLYRRLRRASGPHWLETAVRRTWLPFVLTGVLAALVGWGLGAYAPGATTLGQVRDIAATR
jgi:hypothetical protein